MHPQSRRHGGHDERNREAGHLAVFGGALYRSQTFSSVLKGLANENLMRSTFTVAYDSVLPAWRWFLAHTGSRPIILIGDSQDSAVLIHLISAQLDHQPSVLRRLLAAILVGGNLQVPSGKTVGATFTKVLLTLTQPGLKEPVSTPWVTYPQLYSATCEQGGGASWLQVTSLAGTSTTRPVVNEDIVDGVGGPAWDYHGYEDGLTLGNLLHDVAGEEAAWPSRH